jgi:hypothetical protein
MQDPRARAPHRRGLLTVPGLPEPWTRTRPRAHNSLDAGKRTPAPTAPWKTGTRPPVSHTANRPQPSGWTCPKEGN